MFLYRTDFILFNTFEYFSFRLIVNRITFTNNKLHSIYYTIMDFLLSKYGLIITEFDSIDRGGAEVNTFKFSKYQTIFTE